MKFESLPIAGVWLIAPEPHVDERGLLRRHFCVAEFAAHGLVATVAQGNVSENLRRHTLRGFHYQEPPHAEAKTVSCLRGAMHAVIADIRRDSATFLQHVAVELDEVNRLSIHVPAGCAMAFLSLADHTMLHYYVSTPFAPDSYRGIRYNDPALGVKWPAEPAVISPKDLAYPDFPSKRG
ncbi:MAG: dTDP-4-dehydrorhamnose 3,5-epimerase family protein [Planctomycetaceae bacterium]|nr:dTDP-4-dehydrorhamnose 3,5-epimerase family protein [Planctomycetaceae bacterium]